MTISLDKINHMFGQVRQMGVTLKALEDQFQEDTGCEDYLNPFHLSSEFKRILADIKKTMAHFLIYRYQDTFCPNIPVSDKIRGYEGWFPEGEFDAVEFINRINEEILPKDPERIAYETLLKRAREVLPHDDVPHAHKNVLQGHCYVERERTYRGCGGKIKIDFGTFEKVAAFEKFTQLILDNQTIFTRVAPTQIKARTPIANQIWNDKTLPQTVSTWGGEYIKKAVFFKNGRIDFHFTSAGDCQKVARALAGDEPDVHFPKHEINMNQLFQPPGEEPRRVVRMRGE